MMVFLAETYWKEAIFNENRGLDLRKLWSGKLQQTFLTLTITASES